jgi:hypothetical protein
MAPVACPKCLVVACETTSGVGGLSHQPDASLRDTEWGAKSEVRWCPTLAAAMPDEVFGPDDPVEIT